MLDYDHVTIVIQMFRHEYVTNANPNVTSRSCDHLLHSPASISRFGRGDATVENKVTQGFIGGENTLPWRLKGETFIEWLKETAPDQPDVKEFLGKATLFGFMMLYFWLCDYQHIW